MIGRVGTALGDAGLNIISAAVGRQPDGADENEAVMVVTAESLVPDEVVEAVVASDGFVAGRGVSL
jgi:D-3-phosphoglycerate dehydrogenase